MGVMIQALFCDDMRRDDQGTFILIGTHPGIIFLEQGTEKSVGNYIQVSELPVGEHKMRLRVVFEPEDGGKTVILAKQSTSVSIETPMPFVVTPTGLRLALETDGVIRLFIGIDEEDDQEITSLKVRVREGDSSEEDIEEEA